MKDELRTDGDPIAWRAWSTAQNQLWQLRQPAPPLEFTGEQRMFIDMYAQVREEEQVISLPLSGGVCVKTPRNTVKWFFNNFTAGG